MENHGAILSVLLFLVQRSLGNVVCKLPVSAVEGGACLLSFRSMDPVNFSYFERGQKPGLFDADFTQFGTWQQLGTSGSQL
jgi:hypothetical protein